MIGPCQVASVSEPSSCTHRNLVMSRMFLFISTRKFNLGISFQDFHASHFQFCGLLGRDTVQSCRRILIVTKTSYPLSVEKEKECFLCWLSLETTLLCFCFGKRVDFSLSALRGPEEGLLSPRIQLYLLQTIFYFLCLRSSFITVACTTWEKTHTIP